MSRGQRFNIDKCLSRFQEWSGREPSGSIFSSISRICKQDLVRISFHFYILLRDKSIVLHGHTFSFLNGIKRIPNVSETMMCEVSNPNPMLPIEILTNKATSTKILHRHLIVSFFFFKVNTSADYYCISRENYWVVWVLTLCNWVKWACLCMWKKQKRY